MHRDPMRSARRTIGTTTQSGRGATGDRGQRAGRRPQTSAGNSRPPASGPGLYGGTNDNSLNDPQGVIDFLAANPDKAKAWVDALNKDPELLVPGGLPLTVENPRLHQFLGGVILMTDTRVTNPDSRTV